MLQVRKNGARAGWETYSTRMEDAERRKGHSHGDRGNERLECADDQVWRKRGQLIGSADVAGEQVWGTSRLGNLPYDDGGRRVSGRAFPRRPQERAIELP